MESMYVYSTINGYVIIEPSAKRPKEAYVYQADTLRDRSTWMCVQGICIRYREGKWHPYKCKQIRGAKRLSPETVAALLR